jgi:hypothetical protein
MDAAWRGCGARQGPATGAGIIRGDEQFTFPALPRDRHPASGHALLQRAPNPWRLGSARPAMASAGIAVSGAGQPGHDRAAAHRHAVPAAAARKGISAMSRWMRQLPVTGVPAGSSGKNARQPGAAACTGSGGEGCPR